MRLAAHQYPHSPHLADSVKRLMVEDVLPNAARTDHDAFRGLLNQHKVRPLSCVGYIESSGVGWQRRTLAHVCLCEIVCCVCDFVRFGCMVCGGGDVRWCCSVDWCSSATGRS